MSNTGSTWTNAYSTTAGAGGVEDLKITATGRYVRLYGTQRATPYRYSLWEFQVYGGCGSTGPSGSPSASPTGTGGTGHYPAWAPGIAYHIGDRVSYGGRDYQCQQAHTSIVSWEPPNTPALWIAL